MANIKKTEGKRGITYKVTVSNGYDYKGKKIRKTATFTPDPNRTEKQNRKALNDFAYEFEKAVRNGTYYDGEGITIAEFAQKWFKEYVCQHLEPKTTASYKDNFNAYILPHIGHMKLSKVRPLQIQELWTKLQNENVRRDGKPGGLSGTTVRKCHAALSKMFSCAVQWQLVSENPCAKIAAPKNDTAERDNYFTPEQAVIFLDTLDRGYTVKYRGRKRKDSTGKEYAVKGYTETKQVPLQFRVFYNIALFGGLRCEEILGLTWDSIDYSNNAIAIYQAVSYVERQTRTKTAKNRTSQRTITLPETVMRLIAQLQEEQKRKTEELGTYWNNPEGYLFTQDTGKLMFYSTPYAKFKSILKRHNDRVRQSEELTEEEKAALLLPDITLHGLRHTSATLLISQNLDIRTVSSRLGHAQTSTTMNIYAHALKAQDRKAAIALENMLKPQSAASN